MSKANIIRLLVGLNMILFMLPFFNTCSDTPEKDNFFFESVDVLNDENIEFGRTNNQSDEMDQNAYQLAITPFKETDKDIFSESYFYFCLCFTVIIIFNIIMIYFSIIGKTKSVQFFNYANLAILLLSLLIPYSSGILENLDQIKIGYYLFLINLIIIAWLIKQNSENKNTG